MAAGGVFVFHPLPRIETYAFSVPALPEPSNAVLWITQLPGAAPSPGYGIDVCVLLCRRHDAELVQPMHVDRKYVRCAGCPSREHQGTRLSCLVPGPNLDLQEFVPPYGNQVPKARGTHRVEHRVPEREEVRRRLQFRHGANRAAWQRPTAVSSRSVAPVVAAAGRRAELLVAQPWPVRVLALRTSSLHILRIGPLRGLSMWITCRAGERLGWQCRLAPRPVFPAYRGREKAQALGESKPNERNCLKARSE